MKTKRLSEHLTKWSMSFFKRVDREIKGLKDRLAQLHKSEAMEENLREMKECRMKIERLWR